MDTDASTINFGDNCSIGDVSIGNVAARDINYYVFVNHNKPEDADLVGVAGQSQHTKELQDILFQRGQLLELQIARFGPYCPSHVLVEHKNVLDQLQKLKVEGASL